MSCRGDDSGLGRVVLTKQAQLLLDGVGVHGLSGGETQGSVERGRRRRPQVLLAVGPGWKRQGSEKVPRVKTLQFNTTPP